MRDLLERVILAGYRNTWLLPAGSRDGWLRAEAETAARGLGASTVDAGAERAPRDRRQVRERLATWGVELPRATHPELGAI